MVPSSKFWCSAPRPKDFRELKIDTLESQMQVLICEINCIKKLVKIAHPTKILFDQISWNIRQILGVQVQICGIILKAFLEHLSGKICPKPEILVKFNVSIIALTQNVPRTWNVRQNRRSGQSGAKQPGGAGGAKFDECFRKSASKGARAERKN